MNSLDTLDTSTPAVFFPFISITRCKKRDGVEWKDQEEKKKAGWSRKEKRWNKVNYKMGKDKARTALIFPFFPSFLFIPRFSHFCKAFLSCSFFFCSVRDILKNRQKSKRYKKRVQRYKIILIAKQIIELGQQLIFFSLPSHLLPPSFLLFLLFFFSGLLFYLNHSINRIVDCKLLNGRRKW